ncbi:hypothetical protein Tco_0415661 [Tanacetum coccineum]
MQRGKVENATAEMLRGLDQLMERKEGGGADKTYYDLRDMLPRSSSGYDMDWVIVDRLTKAEIREIQSIGPELVQETTNKVTLIKEKLKAAKDFQKSYVGNMRKHLELKLVDKTLRFVEEPIEIIEREVKSMKHSRIPIVKSIGTRSEVMRISEKLSIHTCLLSKLSLEVLSKVGNIGLLADFSVPLNVLRWFG